MAHASGLSCMHLNLNLVAEYLQYASTIVAVASAIAAVTPTPRDDRAIAKLYKIIDFLALNIGKAKETGKVDLLNGIPLEEAAKMAAAIREAYGDPEKAG